MIHRTPDAKLLAFMTPNPITIGREQPLDRALEVMLRFRFRRLPVMQGGRVTGLLVDRDLRLATGSMATTEGRHENPAKPGGSGLHVEKPRTVGEAMRSPVACLSGRALPTEGARRLIRSRNGAVFVLEEDELIGIVTETDFLLAFLDLCRVNRNSCDDLVRYHMQHRFVTVSPDVTLEEALEAMDRRVGHLVVLDEGRLVGVLSERDLLVALAPSACPGGKVAPTGLARASARVRDGMTNHGMTTSPGDSLSEAAKTMVAYRLPALPVFDRHTLVGVLTQREVIEHYAQLR